MKLKGLFSRFRDRFSIAQIPGVTSKGVRRREWLYVTPGNKKGDACVVLAAKQRLSRARHASPPQGAGDFWFADCPWASRLMA